MSLVRSLQAGSQFKSYIFSHDSKFILCCCGNAIKVFNTKNGEFLHDLNGHTKRVTGVVLNPSNVLQVISCGEDGLLISWDYLDGAKLKQLDLHMTLYGIISINAEKKSIMMLAQTTDKIKVMLWKKDAKGEYSNPKMIIDNCAGKTNLVSFGCSKDCVVSANKKSLTVHTFKKDFTDVLDNPGDNITCVACHPTEYCIATGLENGKIILWQNFCSKGKAIRSAIHWHALPVLCLQFTPDGSDLLSGGYECVLVKWQTNNPTRRDYKPRMGAPLTGIVVSPDGCFYATKHSDNVIELLDISFNIVQVYRGMTRNSIYVDKRNPIPCGLKYDPKWRSIVTNGLLGHLQFYSVSLNRQIFNLDIVGQNYVSPETVDGPMNVTELLNLAISDDGDWLATFEMWDDGVFQPELKLKFWLYSTESQTYTLNTTVKDPHEKKITSMAFRPMHKKFPDRIPTLVSAGSDNCFKLWALVDDSDIYRSNSCWTCESVGTYHGLPPLCADFSMDGSTLVVAFGHLLTVWDPEDNVLRTILSSSLAKKQNIINVKFGSGKCCHQLVVATSKSILSWNLITLSIMWHINTRDAVLFRDPVSDLMAYIERNKTLCVFRPDSPDPIYKYDNISDFDVVDAIFVPDSRQEGAVDLGWPGLSQIYVYNVKQQLITLDLESNNQSQSSKVKVAQNLPPSFLSTMMAEKMERETKSEPVKETAPKTRPPDDSIINMFLHSNEPISLFCDKYLNSLLVKKKKKGGKDQGNAWRSLPMVADSESSSSESEEEVAEPILFQNQPSENSGDKTSTSEVDTSDQDVDMDKLMTMALDWLDVFSEQD